MKPHTVDIRFKRLRPAADMPLPARATAAAAGFDLRADIDAPLPVPARGRAAVPTGIAVALPTGWEGQVRARSGLAAKHGLCLTNGVGTIDADYRGEIVVLLANLSDTPYTIQRGDRIAQLLIAPVPDVRWHEVSALDDTDRGSGGFGSTGLG